jgi:hypothetical protein
LNDTSPDTGRSQDEEEDDLAVVHTGSWQQLKSYYGYQLHPDVKKQFDRGLHARLAAAGWQPEMGGRQQLPQALPEDVLKKICRMLGRRPTTSTVPARLELAAGVSSRQNRLGGRVHRWHHVSEHCPGRLHVPSKRGRKPINGGVVRRKRSRQQQQQQQQQRSLDSDEEGVAASQGRVRRAAAVVKGRPVL